ncbi:MAG: DegT/DnrJ/EryC1/StrS family aminotransferase [Melioribacteraceae bacterium]|nr:DegT/DnrJ/EryC1/StrS family aminotransferase [Melioribacteraceae bacterium]
MKDKIFVNQPTLPELEEFIPLLEEIWESKNLTNMGKFHQELEKKLCEFLDVKYISLFANGTLALIAALQVMRISGEVITTPYSFVATTHALKWNGISPVFCDIEPNTYNLDPSKIENLITPKTTAIVPVHIYGNPCDVNKIEEIADIYGLKVIYDSAHAFGVKLKNESILNFGDLSVLSFHATKIFNTFEGGAIICHDEKTKKRIDYLKNFGFANETTVIAPGINAKMNEMQAAIGLLQLKNVETNIQKRKKIAELYRNNLCNQNGITCIHEIDEVNHNYGYFPIFIDKDKFGISRDELYYKLRDNNIFARRYFYPLISQFQPYKGLESANSENLPIATKVTEQVISLPIYADLKNKDAERIVEIISSCRMRLVG